MRFRLVIKFTMGSGNLSREEFIEQHQTEFENIFKEFIGLKSLSVTGEGIDETVDFLEKLLKKLLKAQIEVIKTAGHPIILAKLAGKSDENVLFYGHYDVMEPGDLNSWSSDPFKLTKTNGRFVARGAGDNKGQLLAQILGIYTYLQTHESLPFNITLFIEGEEEQGSPNLAPTIEKLKNTKLSQVNTAIVVDGSANPDGTNVLRLGNRGVFSFELISKTATHDNHSGSLGNVMENSVTQLLNFLDKIYDSKNGLVKLPHFYDGVTEPTKQELAWIKLLPFDKKQIMQQAGINELDMDQETYYRNLMFKPTFNISSFKAGYLGKGIKTSIPHQAMLKVDCRLVGQQDINQIKTDLFEIFSDEITTNKLEVKTLGQLPPEKTKAPDEQINQLFQAIKRATGKVYIEPAMPGSVPNYVWKDILKVPVFTIPYANSDEHNHDFNENITEKNFYNGIRISYELLNR
ncbi:M20/M25/M40 family metallo-hydrolase [Lactobacillus halodurans]|uniref:M20/M25/M40 family metallo-hydrolase n=1 Tax=Companilactobacillus halodurans TaxID=2584183 RepID=A0A5P0ZUB8_9LACO|nr:M20/M25/M40 family metallo-hydrolase [Companilactobacillus halodurans]